jgi:hypothetical protein
MATITTEQLLENICSSCGIKREATLSRVLSKQELLVLQATITNLKQKVKEDIGLREVIKEVVAETITQMKGA